MITPTTFMNIQLIWRLDTGQHHRMYPACSLFYLLEPCGFQTHSGVAGGALWLGMGQSRSTQRLRQICPHAHKLEALWSTQLHPLACSLDVSALTGSNPAHSGFRATEGHCLTMRKNQLPPSSTKSQPFKWSVLLWKIILYFCCFFPFWEHPCSWLLLVSQQKGQRLKPRAHCKSQDCSLCADLAVASHIHPCPTVGNKSKQIL